jgi:hypothetical protein
MHTVLTVVLPAAALLGSTGVLGYWLGTSRTTARITRSLQTDREVGISVLEDLADRWGVKIVRTETPGGT